MLQSKKKIPPGKVYGEIPLEACKSYPVKIFQDENVIIAVADKNTRNDKITLTIKLEPQGCKTAKHPQIAFYIKGRYHPEHLGYYKSEPNEWRTWIEFYLDLRDLKKIIDALMRIDCDRAYGKIKHDDKREKTQVKNI